MKLITEDMMKKLPKLGETEEMASNEIKIPLKIFAPTNGWTWYITEYSEEEKTAFGYMTGTQFPELGYIYMPDLENLKLPMGLSLERDLSWNEETTLDKVMKF